jgi:transcription elongation factor GreA
MSDAIVMTSAGLAALEAELDRLETVDRREIAERIRAARELGDLSENAEYHIAKEDQAHLETRIKRLRGQLVAAEVRDAPPPTDVVGFGSRVEVEEVDSGRRRTYTLVSAPEAEPGAGRVSIASPVGQALDGARPGDTVRVPAPRGERKLRVIAIGESGA